MKDVQNMPDARGIDIQRVGVKEVHLPLSILVKDNGYQYVLGNLSLCVDLPRNYRGTHMSRFIEILTEWSDRPFSSKEIREILEITKKKLRARRAEIAMKFRYFIPKKAPISEAVGKLDYQCEFRGILEGRKFTFTLGVEVPVTTLCPCSREISEYGAHNQRATVWVRVEYLPGEFIWIEDLVAGIESLGSAQVYPLLKRVDEKSVTERAYHNPKFVEDVVRDVVKMLSSDRRIRRFEVECESLESIHNHNTYAYQMEERRSTKRRAFRAPPAHHH